MKLNEFKNGDLIHRTFPRHSTSASLFFPGSNTDHSFIVNPIELVDITSGIVFYKSNSDKEIYRFSLELYNDEKWDYFPMKYWKIKEVNA